VPPVVNGLGLGLQFYLDKETGRSVIRVLDVESGKVVRQIPSEEVLNFLRELEKRQGPVISLKL
jgi:flagellar protein FlaG